MLAHFAEVVRPTPPPLPDVETQELAALVTRRRQLIEMLTVEKNRVASARVVIRTFYHRLCAAGKAPKVTLIACMRKLLTIINAMLKHQTPWSPTMVHHA